MGRPRTFNERESITFYLEKEINQKFREYLLKTGQNSGKFLRNAILSEITKNEVA